MKAVNVHLMQTFTFSVLTSLSSFWPVVAKMLSHVCIWAQNLTLLLHTNDSYLGKQSTELTTVQLL